MGVYIVATGSGGAWSGQDGTLAMFEGATWSFLAPATGMQVFVIDESAYLHFDGSDWAEVRSPREARSNARLSPSMRA